MTEEDTARHRARMQRKKAVIEERIARASLERGVFLLHTGNGKGKSSAAFGMLARAAWETARAALADPGVALVILDELTYAFKYRWLDLEEALAVFRARPLHQHLIVTGRAAPAALVDAADTVTEMGLVKHAFQAGVKAMPGIEW